MKKLLVFLVMMSLMFGSLGIVLGADQNTYFTAEGVVEFTVSPTLNFPSVKPGLPTSANSILTLGDTNTEDLTVDILLTSLSDDIFTHVALTTTETSITGLLLGPSLSKSIPITINIEDTDAEGAQNVQNKIVLATLSVPSGTLPSEKKGVITYTVTAPLPITPPTE